MPPMAEPFPERLRAVLEARPGRPVDHGGGRAAAVLLPLIGGVDPALILTLRTDTLPSHKGQISFPGGSIDPRDGSARAAALREAEEELGLSAASVRVLGELDEIETYVSGYLVTPVVGFLEARPRLIPNPAEVAAVLEVPVAELVDEIRAEPGFTHGGRPYPTEAWIWNDNVIWGVTARILRLFLERLAEAGLNPAPGPEWPRWASS
jgi:8-oxo-dGTP pyrophosphatase MutT (NUDIX family)